MVQQPVQVPNDGRYQTKQTASAYCGSQQKKKADVTLYAKRRMAGNLSQDNSSFLTFFS